MTNDTMTDEARRMLGEVHNGRQFMLKDGSALSSVRELYDSLKKMDEEIFTHHVREGHNDFGNWIKDVFKDYQLANELFASKTKSDCLNKVGTRIYQLEKMTASPGKVVLTPAAPPAVRPKPKQSKPKQAVPQPAKRNPPKKKSKMDVDPAELEKTIQEINRRYWEKKKLEKEAQKKEEEAILKPLQEQVKKSLDKTEEVAEPEEESSVEDLLEIYEPERFHKILAKDAKTLFSASSVKETASDVKKIFIRDKSERAETKEVLKSVSAKQNPKKDDIITGLQKAHRMETGESER